MSHKNPPIAERRPYSFTHHGITLEDPYHWLRDKDYPIVQDTDVIAYLEAENAYFKSAMKPLEGLTNDLFEEIKDRQKKEDESVPVKEGNYYYQWRYRLGTQYRTWTRWPVCDPSASEIILDEPTLAKGHDYFSIGSLAISHDGRYLAYSTDVNGTERYTLRVKDLEKGHLLDEVIENTRGQAVWAASDEAFFYLVSNENWRSYQTRKHVVGTDIASDHVIYEEPDSGFSVGIAESSSKEYIIISTGDQVTTEEYLVPAHNPNATPTLVLSRREKHDYQVDHQGDRFVIRTNDQHKNFRLAIAPAHDIRESQWTTLIEGRDTSYIRSFQCFDQWIVVEERVEGLDQIRILDRAGNIETVPFPETVFSAHLGSNSEYVTDEIRLGYASMITPDTVYEVTAQSLRLTVKKEREIPSGYDKSHYSTQRILAPARDGASIPVSIVHRVDTPLDGSAPLYLYGYGAYGAALASSFSTARLSLLDRGFIYAIAHVRGGSELGHHWYEQGKLNQRTNTFNDFVDVAQHLIDSGYVVARRLAIAGGSAGGELMGAVVNQAPWLWGAVVLHVPFVDVLNTMLDDSLPLTPGEWPEWGNPIEDKAAFKHIHSYSPYDQLAKGAYPPMMVTAGLNDPRVTYWEPAKYVAKVRALKTDDNPLVLKTTMGAGHGGKSGRWDSLYEVAEEYAFVMSSLGLT